MLRRNPTRAVAQPRRYRTRSQTGSLPLKKTATNRGRVPALAPSSKDLARSTNKQRPVKPEKTKASGNQGQQPSSVPECSRHLFQQRAENCSDATAASPGKRDTLHETEVEEQTDFTDVVAPACEPGDPVGAIGKEVPIPAARAPAFSSMHESGSDDY